MTTKKTGREAAKPDTSTEANDKIEVSAAPVPAKTARPSEPRETKIGKVVKLLKRKNGATFGQIVEATGWQSHTARAALTGLKKKGHVIEREASERGSRYRIVASVFS